MHVQTHILSGWCLGNLFRINARERFFCMLAATLPDLDGLGAILGQEQYWDYHHILGHNIFAGFILSGILTIFSTHRLKAFLIYIGLFHLHLVMDFLGSGPKWTIEYLWPVSRWAAEFRYAWDFFSWQNLGTFFALLIWTYIIIRVSKRTPLEYPMPKLDKQLVDFFLRRKSTATEDASESEQNPV